MVPFGRGRQRKRLAVKATRAAYSNAKWSSWWRDNLTVTPDEMGQPVARRLVRRVSPPLGWLVVAEMALRGLVRLVRSEDLESSQEGR